MVWPGIPLLFLGVRVSHWQQTQGSGLFGNGAGRPDPPDLFQPSLMQQLLLAQIFLSCSPFAALRGVLIFGAPFWHVGSSVLASCTSIPCFREGWEGVSVFLAFSVVLFSLMCHVSECRFENCHQHPAGVCTEHPVTKIFILPRRVERVCNGPHGGCRRTGGDSLPLSILSGSTFKLCPCLQEQDRRRMSWRKTQGCRWISSRRGCGSWSLWGE